MIRLLLASTVLSLSLLFVSCASHPDTGPAPERRTPTPTAVQDGGTVDVDKEAGIRKGARDRKADVTKADHTEVGIPATNASL